MDILERIDQDMKTALRAGEKLRLQLLRTLRSAIKNVQIAKQAVLQEADVLKVIQTELKKRKESVEAFINAKRKELAETESKEAEILEGYLPQQLSDAELDALVSAKAQELGVTDQKQFGQLMGAVMKEVGAKSDGTKVKERVQHFLQKK